MTLADFNARDRSINHIVLAAAREPFLEHMLGPLHTISRRIGFLHHSAMMEGQASAVPPTTT